MGTSLDCHSGLLSNKVLNVGVYVAAIIFNGLVIIVLIHCKQANSPFRGPSPYIPFHKTFHTLAVCVFSVATNCGLLIYSTIDICNRTSVDSLSVTIFDVAVAGQFIGPLMLILGQFELAAVLRPITVGGGRRRRFILRGSTLYFFLLITPYLGCYILVRIPLANPIHRVMFTGLGFGGLSSASAAILFASVWHQKGISTKSNQQHLFHPVIAGRLSAYTLIPWLLILLEWFVPSVVVAALHFESFGGGARYHHYDHLLLYIPPVSQVSVPLFHLVVNTAGIAANNHHHNT